MDLPYTFITIWYIHGGRFCMKFDFVIRSMRIRDIYIYEQPRIIQQRHDYLRCLQRNHTEDRPVVYGLTGVYNPLKKHIQRCSMCLCYVSTVIVY